MPDRPIQIPASIAAKLAERYGMTPEAIEAIIGSVSSEYSKPIELPPTQIVPEAAIEQAASQLNESKTIPNPAQSNPTAPLPQPSVKSSEAKPIGGGVIAIIFAVLLIALAIALSFEQGYFNQRHFPRRTKPVDTIQNILSQEAQKASTPPQNPSDVPPGQVPPEALVVPREEPLGTSGKPSNSGITNEKQAEKASAPPSPKPVLQTSSNFEAEERLAELHADGNSRAHMKAVHKNGRTVYQIYKR